METQQDKKLRVLASVSGVIAVFLIVNILVLFSLLRVTPKSDTYVMELGDSLSGDISDYLEGKEYVLKYGTMETEGLDRYKAGEYTIYWKVFYQKIPFTIVIEDTVPPVIVRKKGSLCMQVGRKYSVDDFYDAVEELSGEVRISFVEKQKRQRMLQEI